MGIMPSRQPSESKKVRIRRRPVAVATPAAGRTGKVVKQAGLLWQRKMHTLAMRFTKDHARRDRSGSPMKRG